MIIKNVLDENDSIMCNSNYKNYIYTFYDVSTKWTNQLSCPIDFSYLILLKMNV